MTYTAELFNGSLPPKEIKKRKANLQEAKEGPRLCQTQGCLTRLSAYNPDELCFKCQQAKTDAQVVTMGTMGRRGPLAGVGRDGYRYLPGLEEAKEADGRTWPELAKEVGVTRHTLMGWAYCKHGAGNYPIEKLACVLGVSVYKLIGEEG